MNPRYMLPLLLVSGPAALAAVPDTLTGCAAIENPDDRLLCYDRAAGRYEPAALPRPETSTIEEETVFEADGPTAPGPTLPERPQELPVLSESEPVDRSSPFSVRWQTNESGIDETFVITPYKPNYVLPVSYASNLNEEVYPDSDAGLIEDKIEAKFQLSFKAKLWDGVFRDIGDVWFGYTQQAYWQVYNSEQSAPFRETNYEPELILGVATDYTLLGWDWRYVNVAFNHQSNGRSDPLSRSWNRIIVGTAIEKDNLAFQARYWWRLPEDDDDDNNKDIEEFIGKGELWAFYRDDAQTWAAMIRNNFDLDDNRGAFELNWSFPLFGSVKGYMQYFYGYGESLIEYDQKHHRVGLGLLLSDWL